VFDAAAFASYSGFCPVGAASPETLVDRLWIHLGVDEGVDFSADIAVRLADVGAD
jgi:hypothetical protein